MSLSKAAQQLQENLAILKPYIHRQPMPMQETVMWNLNAALLNITKALASIESDLDTLKRRR